MPDDDEMFEVSVEEEIQTILSRYRVAVEIEEASAGEEIILECHATLPGEDEVLASLTFHLPAISHSDMGDVSHEDSQSKCISLAVIAMAKLLQIQEQTRPEFNFFSGNCAEA